jgi:hypothetical protein
VITGNLIKAYIKGGDFRLAERQLGSEGRLYRMKYVRCYSSIPVPEFVQPHTVFLYLTTARGCKQNQN